MDWKFSGGTFRGSTSSLLFIVSADVRYGSVSVALAAGVSVSVALVAGVSVSAALVAGVSVSMSIVSVGVSADHLHTASTH